jgi:hypothetical protein
LRRSGPVALSPHTAFLYVTGASTGIGAIYAEVDALSRNHAADRYKIAS